MKVFLHVVLNIAIVVATMVGLSYMMGDPMVVDFVNQYIGK